MRAVVCHETTLGMEGCGHVGRKLSQRLMRRPLIGLDIDSCSVRMVRLRRNEDGYVVAGAAISEIAPVDNDPELHRANTIEAIIACFEALGAGKKMAVCGLRGSEVIVRGFEFPGLPPEEVRGAVELEASQMCPFSAGEGTLDHQVTTSQDVRTRGFWVAASRRQVEDKRQLVREAGLQCVLMDIDGLALLNCFENVRDAKDNADETKSAILDVGDLHASLAVVDSADRPFVRDIRCGSRDILACMSRDTKMTPEDISAALLAKADSDDVQLRRSLEGACVGLLDEIFSTLRYYSSQNRSTRVGRMLVCGSFARAQGFIEFLAARLPLEVILWDPVGRMPREEDAACEAVVRQAGPALAVAAGLAMRMI